MVHKPETLQFMACTWILQPYLMFFNRKLCVYFWKKKYQRKWCPLWDPGNSGSLEKNLQNTNNMMCKKKVSWVRPHLLISPVHAQQKCLYAKSVYNCSRSSWQCVPLGPLFHYHSTTVEKSYEYLMDLNPIFFLQIVQSFWSNQPNSLHFTLALRQSNDSINSSDGESCNWWRRQMTTTCKS